MYQKPFSTKDTQKLYSSLDYSHAYSSAALELELSRVHTLCTLHKLQMYMYIAIVV